MLQKHAFQESGSDGDQSQFLTPSYLFDILRRRALHFAIPFVLVFVIGSLIAMVWPATYLSEGRILVESQQIPTELVRPTVATLANERIQIIQQRIMTRDNLLAIAKKFQLTTNWRGRMSGTEILDFIRERTQIKPVELTLANTRLDKQAIAFTVGFVHERPEIAAKVANEFVTMILNEDVRGRTNSASETTRFLTQEVKRLEGQLGLLENQISQITRLRSDAAADDGKVLALLKAELLIKGATYSDTHPDFKALQRKISALEKSSSLTDKNGVSIDTLQAQRLNLEKELTTASQKLSAARMGENLEAGQQSERLQVIEQATLPEKPISPNRPKIFGFAFVIALMAGAGWVVAAEMLNPSIRRSTDLYSVIDSSLVVSIPYISTRQELKHKRKRLWFVLGIITAVLVVGLIAILFVLPPLDVLFDKAIVKLLR